MTYILFCCLKGNNALESVMAEITGVAGNAKTDVS